MQAEILEVVATICDAFGLTWFADSGTCLGAVRHQGPIPWDDDIDIAMPLEDYDTFCRVAPEVLEGSGYGVYQPETTDHYPPLFAKVYKEGTRFVGEQMMEAGFVGGIFVDVFAYARLDSHPRKAKRQVDALVFWQRMSYLYHIAHPYLPAGTPLKPVVHAVTSLVHRAVRMVASPAGILKRFRAVVVSGDGRGDWTDVFYAQFGTFATETLFPPVSAPFGDMVVPIPHDADAYLREMYGNYLQFPPEDERIMKPPVILDFGDGVNVVEEGRIR